MNFTKLNCSSPRTILTAVAVSILSSYSISQAAELTIKAGEFQQVLSLDAVALPMDAIEISINPKKWSGFKINKVLAHGSLVKKGDILIWIETTGLDEAIESSQNARVLQKLELEAAQQEMLELEKSIPMSLEAAQRRFDRYQENYDYYKKTLRPNTIDSAKYSVKRAENNLAYQNEELRQLQKMYKENGLIDETEEIILQRAKNRVVGYERELRETKQNAAFTIKVEIPRKDIDLKKGLNSESHKLESIKKTLQRSLKIKQEELSKLVGDDTKKQEYLEDLIADRKLMDCRSPADGIIHYGHFQHGKWLSKRANRVLQVGGHIPAQFTAVSIVPTNAKYQFNAFLKESDKMLFSETHPARLKLKNNLWVNYKAVAMPASAHPNFQNQWLVSFVAKDIDLNAVYTGSKATIYVTAASSENVISVPVNCVTEQLDGTFTVKLKMAEGKPKKTPVKLGRQSANKIEIISGVEAGQVIITPEK